MIFCIFNSGGGMSVTSVCRKFLRLKEDHRSIFHHGANPAGLSKTFRWCESTNSDDVAKRFHKLSIKRRL